MIVSSNPAALPMSANARPILPAPTIVQGQSRLVFAVAVIFRSILGWRGLLEKTQLGVYLFELRSNEVGLCNV